MNNFKRLVSGFILSDRKNIQEINSVYGDKDQSSLNRFVTESDWNLHEMNRIRLHIAKEAIYDKNHKGMIILDDSLLHKTGRKMEKANYHRSGTTKKEEWGHSVVDTLYVDMQNSNKRFPISIQPYLRKIDADGLNPFKTKRQIAMGQIDLALSEGITGIVCADAWYYSDELAKSLKERGLSYILGVKSSLKISIDRKERISINNYMNELNDKNFQKYELANGTYHLHTKEVSVRGDGKEMLLISYKEGDEDTVKCYVANIFRWSSLEYMTALLKRWNIEVLHRDTKQHLGLEDYQVRKYRGMQVVALAILAAYTLLILNALPSLLEKFRPLKTIGEMCRFAKLAAQKSKYWMKKTLGDIIEGANVLNQLVLVKNAKV